MTELSYEAKVERDYRHNFIVNFLDGTFFWAGASFITTSTILPLYVNHFTDSKLLLGLISAIASGGWLLPQLLTANRVQQMPVKKVAPVVWGFFSERVPVMLLALSTWLFAAESPLLALAFFYLTIVWHTVGAGIVAVGWQDMIAKIIPRERRGRFFGVTNFSGTVTGLLGGIGAAWVLDNYDFPTGYVVSFSAAALLIFISWIFLTQTREPSRKSTLEPVSQREYWAGLPKVLRADRNFRHYILSRVTITLSGMAGGFVAVYAVERWALPDSRAGYFTTALLVGQAISYLLFGFLADRKGHKLVLELSVISGTLAIGLAWLASDPVWFYLAFALTGGSISGYVLSGVVIAFEFSPPDVRPTYIGLNNTITGMASIFAPLLGALLAHFIGYRGLFVVSFFVGIIAFALMHWWVREPREVESEMLPSGVPD
jgi:MFS family permease